MSTQNDILTNVASQSIEDARVKPFAGSSATLDTLILEVAQTGLKGVLEHTTVPSPRREQLTEESNAIDQYLQQLKTFSSGEASLAKSYLVEPDLVTHYHTASRIVRTWTGMISPSYIPDFIHTWFPSTIDRIDEQANQTWRHFIEASAQNALDQEAVVIFKRKWMVTEELARLGHEKLTTPRKLQEWKNKPEAPAIVQAPPVTTVSTDQPSMLTSTIALGLMLGIAAICTEPISQLALSTVQDYRELSFSQYLLLLSVFRFVATVPAVLVLWKGIRFLTQSSR